MFKLEASESLIAFIVRNLNQSDWEWPQHCRCVFNTGDFAVYNESEASLGSISCAGRLCVRVCLYLSCQSRPESAGPRSVYFYCTAIEFMHSCALR